jgi:hypothetical protein
MLMDIFFLMEIFLKNYKSLNESIVLILHKL